MADDHRNIQHPTGRCSGKTAHGQADTLGKIAQKVECSEQKDGKGKLVLFEKTSKVGIYVEKTNFLHFLYMVKILIFSNHVEM